MKVQRLVRVNELIRREIAANLSRFARGTDINVAAVTITRVSVASNLRTAQVWVSVLKNAAAVDEQYPDKRVRERGDCERVLKMLLDRRSEIQSHLARTLKIKYTPRLFFELDDSLAEGDRVLAILDDLDVKQEPDKLEDDDHA